MLSSLVVLVLGVVAWQLATTVIGATFFPTPLKIGAKAWELLFGGWGSDLQLTPAFFSEFLPSLGRILAGFALGSATGVIIGAIIGRSRVAAEYVSPVVDYLRAIPATASLPIFILILGGGDSMRVVFIAWGLSWYVLINTAAGIGGLDRTMVDMTTVFRVGQTRRLFTVLIPAAAPQIFAGLRIALTAAVLLSVVSEFFLAENGIGFQMMATQRRFYIVDMWAWMLILALLGALLNWALLAVERRTLRWHRLSHGGQA